MSTIPVALQLYTVRSETAKDFIGTLRDVARMGYAGVELAGTGSLRATELKAVLDDLNLARAGSHVGIDPLEKELGRAIEFNLELGNPYMVCPGVPEARRSSADGYRALAASFDAIGAECRKHGLTFAYHNHHAEFQTFDGQYGLDILYGASDPDLVKAEVDTYWVQYAGEDPAAYIRRYPGRCPLIHLKDMADDADRSFAEVGEGILDFDAIFAACEVGGARWYIVEQDTCKRPPLESARLSLENLKVRGMA